MNDFVLIISSNKVVKHYNLEPSFSLSFFFQYFTNKILFSSLSLPFHCLVAKLNYCCLDVEEKERKERTHTTILFVFPSTPISPLFRLVLFLFFFSRTTRGEQRVKEILNRKFSFSFLFFSNSRSDGIEEEKSAPDVVVDTYGEVAANSCYCCN